MFLSQSRVCVLIPCAVVCPELMSQQWTSDGTGVHPEGESTNGGWTQAQLDENYY